VPVLATVSWDSRNLQSCSSCPRALLFWPHELYLNSSGIGKGHALQIRAIPTKNLGNMTMARTPLGTARRPFTSCGPCIRRRAACVTRASAHEVSLSLGGHTTVLNPPPHPAGSASGHLLTLPVSPVRPVLPRPTASTHLRCLIRRLSCRQPFEDRSLQNALSAAVLAAALALGAPQPAMLAARADDGEAAGAVDKRRLAVERRKEMLAQACVPFTHATSALPSPATGCTTLGKIVHCNSCLA